MRATVLGARCGSKQDAQKVSGKGRRAVAQPWVEQVLPHGAHGVTVGRPAWLQIPQVPVPGGTTPLPRTMSCPHVPLAGLKHCLGRGLAP